MFSWQPNKNQIFYSFILFRFRWSVCVFAHLARSFSLAVLCLFASYSQQSLFITRWFNFTVRFLQLKELGLQWTFCPTNNNNDKNSCVRIIFQIDYVYVQMRYHTNLYILQCHNTAATCEMHTRKIAHFFLRWHRIRLHAPWENRHTYVREVASVWKTNKCDLKRSQHS